eukprot:COSAG06_NODE_62801_length_264_cov_0.618182_1_plen_24_part_01
MQKTRPMSFYPVMLQQEDVLQCSS